MGPPPYISEHDGSTHIAISLKPRGSRDAIEGAGKDALVVRVSAPPLEGRANAALCKLLAKAKPTLTRAYCLVGRVTRSFSKTVARHRVISQRPRAGRRLPARTRVKLVVSNGRR